MIMKKRKNKDKDHALIKNNNNNNNDDDDEMMMDAEEETEEVVATSNSKNSAADVEGDEAEEDGNNDVDDDDEQMANHQKQQQQLQNGGRDAVENPFLDSFYGLASLDPKERSQAAQIMLHHSLFGPTANSKDAAYTFRRLLNGVCSGRAAARQGNASALTNFLKLAFSMDKMEGVRENSSSSASKGVHEVSADQSMLRYVRSRLLNATDIRNVKGPKKSSEERDHQFGRLFGILAIVRSGILATYVDEGAGGADDAATEKEVAAVASLLTMDLVDLFWQKRVMREPAAHAIITLLISILKGCKTSDGEAVFATIVKTIIIPKMLLVDSSRNPVDSRDVSTLSQVYCAEQIAIAISIQTNLSGSMSTFPQPLDEPILSVANLPRMASALESTSTVMQPRAHLVWDTVWAFLMEHNVAGDNNATNRTATAGGGQWVLRDDVSIGEDGAAKILEALVTTIIEKHLLAIENGSQTSKSTHNRCSLAIGLIRSLCGVAFSSSIVGMMRLKLDADIIEGTVFKSSIIKRAFFDIIRSGQKNKIPHMLKPMAVNALQTIALAVNQRMEDDVSSTLGLAFVRPVLSCDVRFDAITKTSFVTGILGLTSSPAKKRNIEDHQIELWTAYTSLLQSTILEKSCALQKDDSTAEVSGYVELLYKTTKQILHMSDTSSSPEKFHEFQDSICKSTQTFFMVAAFFDCTNVTKKAAQKLKSKEGQIAIQTARSLAKASKNGNGCFQHALRSTISAKFFSLLSEHVHHVTYGANRLLSASSVSPSSKETRMYDALSVVVESTKALQEAGAVRYSIPQYDDDDDDNEDGDDENSEGMDTGSSSLEDIIEGIQGHVKETTAAAEASSSSELISAKKRLATGLGSLALALYLHQLKSGTAEDMVDEDDPDASDEDDDSEIKNAIQNLKAILDHFLTMGNDDGDSDSNAEASNPLLGLAESCANILSSPLSTGNSTRGASPKLLREAIKMTWVGGLGLAHTLASSSKTLFDAEVVGILLEAIGADGSGMGLHSDEEDGEEMDVDEEEDDDENSDDDDDDDDESAASEQGIFGRATGVIGQDSDDEDDNNNDDNDDDTTNNKTAKTSGENDSDSNVELDSSNLQSMLEDDSDADIDAGELEHHEGADAALAKLIKLKQDMRKAGAQAREMLEASNQLRCTLLLELALNRSDPTKLFRKDLMVAMLVPLLKHRMGVEKSVSKLADRNSKTGIGEKRSLLNRLTQLIKSDFGKLRLATMTCSEPEKYPELAKDVATQLVELAKKAESKEHSMCCSSGLVSILRSNSAASTDGNELADIQDVLQNAVKEWSTIRSKLSTSLFEDLLGRVSGTSARMLLHPLLAATKDSRASFLKIESFRLLTVLFSQKHIETEPDFELTKKALVEGRSTAMKAFSDALADEEMMKPKALRVILKALDKFVASMSAPYAEENGKQLDAILKSLKGIEAGDNNSAKQVVTKSISAIDLKLIDVSAALAEAKQKTLVTPKKSTKGSGRKSSSKKKKGKRR